MDQNFVCFEISQTQTLHASILATSLLSKWKHSKMSVTMCELKCLSKPHERNRH